MRDARRAAFVAALGAWLPGCGETSAVAALPEPFATWELPVGEGQVAASSGRGVVVVYDHGEAGVVAAAYAAALSGAGCAMAPPEVVDGLAAGTCALGADQVRLTAGAEGTGRVVVGVVREGSAP